MKRMILTGLCMTIACISGCANSLPPHEKLNQAVKKSFDASGFNYSSKSRVTSLSVSKLETMTTPDSKSLKHEGAVIDIVSGFTVNIDGAVDTKSKKSQAVYDLNYSKDNVEVSIKLPLLIDYSSQTIYIGPSFLNTLLDIASPQMVKSKGQLIKINIPELVREQATNSSELPKLLGDDRFNSKNMDLMSNVFKAASINVLARLDDARFSDQPLTEEDRKTGVERRIQITLGHSDTVAVVLDLVDSISLALFQEGAISNNEYAMLHMLTDRQKLEELIDIFEMTMTQDIGVSNSGYVSYVVSQLKVTDKEGNYHVELENVSAFDRYNAPHFSITPIASRIVDFSEVLNAIKAIKTEDQDSSQPPLGAPDDSDSTDGDVPLIGS